MTRREGGTKRKSSFFPFRQPTRYYGHRYTQVCEPGENGGQGTQKSRHQQGCVSQRLTSGWRWEKVRKKRQREEEGPSYPAHHFADEMAKAIVSGHY